MYLLRVSIGSLRCLRRSVVICQGIWFWFDNAQLETVLNTFSCYLQRKF